MILTQDVKDRLAEIQASLFTLCHQFSDKFRDLDDLDLFFDKVDDISSQISKLQEM